MGLFRRLIGALRDEPFELIPVPANASPAETDAIRTLNMLVTSKKKGGELLKQWQASAGRPPWYTSEFMLLLISASAQKSDWQSAFRELIRHFEKCRHDAEQLKQGEILTAVLSCMSGEISEDELKNKFVGFKWLFTEATFNEIIVKVVDRSTDIPYHNEKSIAMLARQLDVLSHVSEWCNLPGLQAQVQMRKSKIEHLHDK
jgi:hypothetical protein